MNMIAPRLDEVKPMSRRDIQTAPPVRYDGMRADPKLSRLNVLTGNPRKRPANIDGP